MQEVQAYLKECGAFFIATADGDQPHVRPFGSKRPEVERFNEHHPDPNMPEQFDQEDGLFKFEKKIR